MRRRIWAFVVCLLNQWLLKHMSTNRDFIAINSLVEERASLGAFRMYVCSICAHLVLSVSCSSWCLRRSAVCDCCTPWTFHLPFLCQYRIAHIHTHIWTFAVCIWQKGPSPTLRFIIFLKYPLNANRTIFGHFSFQRK